MTTTTTTTTMHTFTAPQGGLTTEDYTMFCQAIVDHGGRYGFMEFQLLLRNNPQLTPVQLLDLFALIDHYGAWGEAPSDRERAWYLVLGRQSDAPRGTLKAAYFRSITIACANGTQTWNADSLQALADGWSVPFADILAIIDHYGSYDTPEDRPACWARAGLPMPERVEPPVAPAAAAHPHTTTTTESSMTTTVADLRRNKFAVVEAVLTVSRRVLLYGPPGTGKTHAATKAALDESATTPQPVYAITLTDETPMTELRGHFIVVDGKFIWHDGIAIRAWREGARLVLNEIDHAGGDVQSFLHVVLDDPTLAQLTLPTGEVVRPAAGFQVVATMNGVPLDLPMALRDRFPVTIEIAEVHPKALEALPTDLRAAARHTTLVRQQEQRVSIRIWEEFARLREEMGPAMAAVACFGDRGQEVLDGLKIGNMQAIGQAVAASRVTARR
jgi:hypothetical protein